MLYFENDYCEGAHPAILQKLTETNFEKVSGYGTDPYCASAKEKIRAACACPEADVFFISGGTQANSIVIASILRRWEGVIAAATGHVAGHEAGAIEFTGHKVIGLPQKNGKLDAATVEDFCHFLDTISKPSLIEANFGVIDAQGAAAMFEVDYYKYTMYDANNPKDAPYGYIARTNFSFAGEANRGAGYVRYMEADRVLMRASATGGITPQGIFNDLSRSFRNGMLDIDLKNGKFNRPQGSGWFVDQDFIPRNSTSCSIVVQGVKPGEKVELTTMWTMLGYPPTGIAVPLWVKDADRLLPPMVCWDKACAAAPLSDWSLRLSNNVFCYNQGMGTNRYLNWEKLYNMENNGYMQQLVTVEAEVFRRTCLLLDSWRQQGSIDSQEMQKLYQDVEALVRKAYTPLMEQ